MTNIFLKYPKNLSDRKYSKILGRSHNSLTHNAVTQFQAPYAVPNLQPGRKALYKASRAINMAVCARRP